MEIVSNLGACKAGRGGRGEGVHILPNKLSFMNVYNSNETNLIYICNFFYWLHKENYLKRKISWDKIVIQIIEADLLQ